MKKKTVIPVVLAAATAMLFAGCMSSGGSSGFWGIVAIPLGWIMKYCYIFVNDILHLPLSYVFALFLFAFITKAIMFPLSLKQQRSTAKLSAFQPMVEEINRTYAKDPNKRNEETQKLYEEVGYNPLSGCLPMLIQFPIIFGLVEVIYKPLTYMLRIPADVVTAMSDIIKAVNPDINVRNIETSIIAAVKDTPAMFDSLRATAGEYIDTLANLDMSIGSLALWQVPWEQLKLGFSIVLILIPLFSVGTMLLSSLITLKTSGQSNSAGAGAGRSMMVVSSLLFGTFSFTYPAAFSLYWGFQSLIAILQAYVLRAICDPEELRRQAVEEMQEKRRARKASRKTTSTIRIKEASGEVVEKTVSVTELNKLRLQKARELDEQRYGEENQSVADLPRTSEYFGEAPQQQDTKDKKEKKDKKDNENEG